MKQFILVSLSIMLLLNISNTIALASPLFISKNLIAEKIAGGFDRSSGFEFVSDKDILIIQKDDGIVKHMRNFEMKKYDTLDVNVFNYETDSGLLGITSTIVDG